MMKTSILAILACVAVGCATHPVSKSKRQEVELLTQTGPYAYLHTSGGGAGGGR